MIGDQRTVADVIGTDAADNGARGGAALAGRHDLPLDHRRRADHPWHLPHLGRDRIEIAQHAGLAIDPEMAVEAEDAADQIGAEAVHDRHDDDQGRDAGRYAEQREDRDDRDEAFLPPRPQIAERDHPFERAEDHVANRCTTASSGRSWRAPLRRCFHSILPAASPRGPMISWSGRPIRSIAANLAPGDSSRSSYSTSSPAPRSLP